MSLTNFPNPSSVSTKLMEKEDNVSVLDGRPKLKLLTGGKGPPDHPVENWLADFEVGTTFVARHRNSNEVDYNLYYVLYKDLPEVVLLKWQLPDGKVLDYYVDPVRFSRLFPEKKILSVIKPEEEPRKEAEVSENGNSDRSD